MTQAQKNREIYNAAILVRDAETAAAWAAYEVARDAADAKLKSVLNGTYSAAA